MCTVCGCGEASVDTAHHPHTHDHDHDHHHHDHGHDHGHGHHQGDLHFGRGEAGVTVGALDQKRIVAIERDVLGHNDRLAAVNRARFAAAGLLALNLVSSPGAGKTTLLCRTITDLRDRYPMAVIEGDQQTTHDADRIRATGAPALQVNTGKGCHLDAHMVAHAVDHLTPPPGAVLFIENVGNLVCPAAFDLGEAHKVVILSVTEGEDKPLKYPDIFAAADLMLLNKVDLLPHVSFDVATAIGYARRVNPAIEVIAVSATAGTGLADWYAWMDRRRAAGRPAAE
jgi:hydrogenase nickel incorporation protein HypB